MGCFGTTIGPPDGSVEFPDSTGSLWVAVGDQREWLGLVEVARREKINHKEAPTAKNNKHHPNVSANLRADCLECRMAGSIKSRVSQRADENMAANPSIRLVRDQNSVAGRANHKMRLGRMPRTIAIPHTNKISGVGVISGSVQANNATIFSIDYT